MCEYFIGVGGRIKAAGLPADYRLVSVANSPAREGQAEVYKMVDAYIKTFSRQFDEGGERIKSLYLYSESPGTGKTTTAAALLNEYIAQHYVGALKRGQQPLQMPAYFLDVNNWQTLFNEFNRSNIPRDIGERASREYYRRESLARTAPFAVLDDIGVRTATEAFRGDLHAIINHRCANGLATIYTSNLPLAEMESVFDARLYDRMRDQCAELSFVGQSKRGRR
ncbi:DNA replication protein [Bacillus sp. JJ722]